LNQGTKGKIRQLIELGSRDLFFRSSVVKSKGKKGDYSCGGGRGEVQSRGERSGSRGNEQSASERKHTREEGGGVVQRGVMGCLKLKKSDFSMWRVAFYRGTWFAGVWGRRQIEEGWGERPSEEGGANVSQGDQKREHEGPNTEYNF